MVLNFSKKNKKLFAMGDGDTFYKSATCIV
uniref:Uncharacterized protein n=1 Tax=Rhizophora mucronata TaxID=61149 RepID=A0A2P2NNR3_RHIMU